MTKTVKICDLTQFYSPLSGGVKRYVHEKIAYISNYSPDDKHVLIIPGPKNEVTTNARSRIYSIRSPLVSRSSRYRALLNLRAIEEILERERPDLIESSDPYQIGWKAIAAGRALKNSSGWILPFAFSRSVSARRHEISGQTRHAASDEIDPRICAQTLQSFSSHAGAVRKAGRAFFPNGVCAMCGRCDSA